MSLAVAGGGSFHLLESPRLCCSIRRNAGVEHNIRSPGVGSCSHWRSSVRPVINRVKLKIEATDEFDHSIAMWNKGLFGYNYPNAGGGELRTEH